MEHFSDETWADFVRHLPHFLCREAMQKHLDDGCEQCGEAYRVWESIARMMSREQQYRVPEIVERESKAAYLNWRRLFVVPKRARLASLLFDSLRDPLASGVRSGTQHGRRVVHSVGAWSIDVALESGSERIVLDGQVLRAPEREDQKPIEVFAIADGKLLGNTSVSEFGEFQLQCELHSAVTVYVDIPGESPVAVPIEL